MIGPLERKRLGKLLGELELSDIEDLILERAHPMVLIGLHDLSAREKRQPLDRMPIGASRWGGIPDVPTDFTWPAHRDGHPLHFLMQLDLAQLPQFDGWPLPSAGLLYVFAGMTDDDYSIDAQVFHVPETARLMRTASPHFEAGDMFLEYFPAEFEPFLLMGTLGIDIQYRDANRVDLIELIEARYPEEDWRTLLARYHTLSNRAADIRHAQLETSGYPRQWWQVGQLFGVTRPEHQEESQSRYAERSAHSGSSRWRQLASLESNAVTGFQSLSDARPYRLLTREPASVPWTRFEIETHVDMG